MLGLKEKLKEAWGLIEDVDPPGWSRNFIGECAYLLEEIIEGLENDDWLPISDETEFENGKSYLIQIEKEVKEAVFYDDQFYWCIPQPLESKKMTDNYVTHRSGFKFYKPMPGVNK